MAIVNNDLMIRTLAGLVGKGTLALEPSARPGVMLGGRNFALSSVSFDNATGSLVFRVRDERNKEISSSLGVRDIVTLSSDALRSFVDRALQAREVRRQSLSVRNGENTRRMVSNRVSL